MIHHAHESSRCLSLLSFVFLCTQDAHVSWLSNDVVFSLPMVAARSQLEESAVIGTSKACIGQEELPHAVT